MTVKQNFKETITKLCNNQKTNKNEASFSDMRSASPVTSSVTQTGGVTTLVVSSHGNVVYTSGTGNSCVTSCLQATMTTDMSMIMTTKHV